MIKYILQGIGMLFVRPKKAKRTKPARKDVRENEKDAARALNKVWRQRAEEWVNKTDIQELYDFVDRHDLGEVQILVDSHRNVWWTVPVVQRGVLGKNAYYYSPERQRMENSSGVDPEIPELRRVVEKFSPEICDALSGLLKEDELLTLVVGAGYVELEWVHRAELLEFVGEKRVVIAGDPVRVKLRAWFRKNREDIENLMDSHGVVRLRGLVNENGVKAFVLENGNEGEVLFQDKDSTEVIGKGSFGKELACYFNECEIGKLKERLRPWVDVYNFEFGTYSSLTRTSSGKVVEVLFPEA